MPNACAREFSAIEPFLATSNGVNYVIFIVHRRSNLLGVAKKFAELRIYCSLNFL